MKNKTKTLTNKQPAKTTGTSLFLLCFLIISSLITNCQKQPRIPELTEISWIKNYNYKTENIFPVKTSGKIPGPRISVTIGEESQYCLLDFNKQGLIISENAYKSLKFEPVHLVNSFSGNDEMLLEAGYLENVKILDLEYETIYASIVKHSKTKFSEKGVIGPEFLFNNCFTLDLKNGICAFSQDIESINLPDQNLITLKDLSSQDNIPFKFYGNINNSKTLMAISTTKRKSQISPELLQQLSGSSYKKEFSIDTLEINNKIFINVLCNVNPDIAQDFYAEEPLHFLIGLNVLEKSLLTINFKKELMLLE